jgi:hypothetical protein
MENPFPRRNLPMFHVKHRNPFNWKSNKQLNLPEEGIGSIDPNRGWNCVPGSDIILVMKDRVTVN